MSEYEQLVDLINSARGGDDAAQSVLDAGYCKPRTVMTVEDLDALPDRSVVLECGGLACQKHGPGTWIEAGGRTQFPSGRVNLPVVVLFTAEVTA